MSPRFLLPALALLTLAVFWRVVTFGFIDADDLLYVTGNTRVQAGLSWNNLVWAFETTSIGNYHPITWLSLMLDREVWNDWAGGYHATNLALHTLNVLLLFVALRQLTGEVWKSGFVAALFAVHPLHVESVAWISERKGLLATLFGLGALIAYTRYVRRRVGLWLWSSVAFFALSLLCKAAMITLPFLFLVLDFWPLGRLRSRDARDRTLRLVAEKTPLLIVAAIFGAVALSSQSSAGAVVDVSLHPFSARLGTALSGYAIYLYQTLVPIDLAFFYPLPRPPNSNKLTLVIAAILLATLSGVAWRERGERPYLLTGWLWFLGTLVPMIGLVQLGGARGADRYTYVPIVGLFIALTWWVPSVLPDRGWVRRVLPGVALLVVGTLATAASIQTGYWRTQHALFTRTLEVAGPSTFAHDGLARALVSQGRHDAAIAAFERALEIDPDHTETRIRLAVTLKDRGQLQDALDQLRRSAGDPGYYSEAQFQMAIVFSLQKRFSEAIAALKKVESAGPLQADRTRDAELLIGRVLIAKGQTERAIRHWQIVLELRPDAHEIHHALGETYLEQGNSTRGGHHLEKAAQIEALLR